MMSGTSALLLKMDKIRLAAVLYRKDYITPECF
jgi:hypothetical protein